jgi:thiol-disulfide isomerase/thioredoxin
VRSFTDGFSPRLVLACIALISCMPTLIKAQAPPTKIKIGSHAPAIDVEHWIGDHNAGFEPTTEFKPGHVYVIEFWATWSNSSLRAIPHLADLQTEYADRKVQVICIGDEAPKVVEKFLERSVTRDNLKRTFGDLSGLVSLTTDPDKSAKQDYFHASHQNQIPSAFIIGKTGLIEWIGSPMNLDEPLKQIVADQWDRETFAIKYEEARSISAQSMNRRRKLNNATRRVQEKFTEGEYEAAIDMIVNMLQDRDYEPLHDALAVKLNEFAWPTFQKHEANGNVSEAKLKSALRAAEIAAQASPYNPEILDTLAHLVFMVENNLDRAILIQEKATQNAAPLSSSLDEYLDLLLEEKKKREKSKSGGKL